MLQDKYINNLHEMKGFFTRGEKASDTILDFYRNFINASLTKEINSTKKRGYQGKDILLELMLLPFFMVSSIRVLILSGINKITDAEKDVYYRFKNRSDIDWRKLQRNIAKRFIKLSKNQDESLIDSVKCLIADDTLLNKSGRKIEFIGKVYDHAVQHGMVLGFKMLLLGLWDGKSFIPLDFSIHSEKGKNKKRPYGLSKKELSARYHKKRDSGNAGAKRVRELTTNKIVNLIKMIKRAVKNGFEANYLLVDKWFVSEDFIKEIRKIKKGALHVVALCKMDKRKYVYNGKEYSAKQLLKLRKSFSKRSRKINAHYVEIDVIYKGMKLKLFFSRFSKRGKWQLLITTDLQLTYNKAIEIYNIRWIIEVYFKESKQYLNLSHSNSNDFDGQIADATISMIQYIILSLNKRFLSYETTGELFRESQKQLIELTIANRMWKLFIAIQQRILELFEIDIETLYEKIINDKKDGKIILMLLEKVRQLYSEEDVNNAA